MSIKHWCSFGAIAVALSMASGCATAADSGQTIYLDPQTGKVIQHPAPKPPSAQSSQQATTGDGSHASGSGASKGGGYKHWKTPDGTQMLSVDPSHAPKERVVRCPDGSLHMGTVGHGDTQKDNENPEALCGQSAR